MTVQGHNVTYELHTLGWKAFQDLCLTVISEVLGQTIQEFASSGDGGRDGAFHGEWTDEQVSDAHGSFTVQCKYTSKRDSSLLLSEISDELVKAKRLAAKGLARNYVLITNHTLSGVAEEKIRNAFLAIPEIEVFALYGAEWLTRMIREKPRLRMLVPRVYGLGDLSQILDERAYDQAHAILSAMGDDLGKLVITDAYRNSAKAIAEHGFVLLLGEPASGKSTIAASLAVGAIDSLGCSALTIRNANEFIQHWNPHEPRQFYWVDDAFGATQYQKSAALEWSRIFPQMQTAIKHGARILFTSRDYIYRAARNDLKTSAFPLINEAQVIIQVQKLTTEEKAQILYNHIKLGSQTRQFKSAIKPFLDSVVQNERFLPEIARRLGDPVFTRKLKPQQTAVVEFVENPVNFLVDVLRGLDQSSLAALSLLFMNAGTLLSPISLSHEEDRALKLLGAPPADAIKALNSMKGSLVKYIAGEQSCWSFQHPTIGDAFASIVANDPELMEIYLRGTRIEKLVQEITCGHVGLEGVKVIVPKSYHPIVIQRLNTLPDYSVKQLFLAYRCDRAFLADYINGNEDFIPNLIGRIGSYLSGDFDATLFVRLTELKLVSENQRLGFLDRVMSLAVEIPDADFLTDSSIRNVFTDQEISSILDFVGENLIPVLSETIDDWKWNFSSSEDPIEYFQPLKEALVTYRDAFADEPYVQMYIKSALTELADVVEKLRTDSPDTDGDPEECYMPNNSSQPYNIGHRSIFEDVDV